MLNKLNNFRHLWQNMGTRYITYRVGFELKKRTGLLKSKYPVDVSEESFIVLSDWKKLPGRFFFEGKESINFPKNSSSKLKNKIERLRAGDFQFFNAEYKNIGTDYDWLTNPDSRFCYDNKTHWLDINDFSATAGDIKFVWEKSRFSYLNTIIRYDYHFEEDCAEWVFSEIESWIAANPINCGPNYKCSQEISLRMLNWLFALYYYKNSPALTEVRFQKIMSVCRWQMHHIYQNINFSRIAVRNNHAITETMMLYLGGIFFPFFPDAKKYAKQGLKWLEEEVAYQVYEDGTFLQFSHNYHRVLVQLLTWTLYLSELNGQKMSATFLHRSRQTLQYLYQCQMVENGQLPNYGANDGALFFPLNDCEYRDYRPQLNALAYYFNREDLYNEGAWKEDRLWYAGSEKLLGNKNSTFEFQRRNIYEFSQGGYYVAREADTVTFIRCGNHKDRPSHADNLHLDIWYKGKNILRDAGTYKYNTDAETLSYFIGTKGHNTVMLGDNDQMRKGTRFIWYDWTQAEKATLKETATHFTFEGEIRAFEYLEKGIKHRRRVEKKKDVHEWQITDKVTHNTELPLRQIWHVHPDFKEKIHFFALDESGKTLTPEYKKHWYSSEYGVREAAEAIIFSTEEKTIITKISIL